MSLFALVDCNNFYASCERVFNPRLEKKPLIILSNNDGCVIARSNEAKVLGIPMGAPFYQYKSLCQRHQVHVYSSNFSLYGEMSTRVMSLLKMHVADMEIYSIDEAFLKLPKPDLNFLTWLRQHIKQCTGIPVSIGLATTKTLAKMANVLAKKSQRGVVYLDEHLHNNTLQAFPVGDIWGVGRRLAKRLNAMGIYTAKELAQSDPKRLRGQFSVVMEQIIYELRGKPCYELTPDSPQKSIMSSRSFGCKVTEFNDIAEALANYAAIACGKLRQQGLFTQTFYVFLQTNLHKQEYHYQKSELIHLPCATDDTRIILQYAKKSLHHLFKPHLIYKKVGIVLLDLVGSHDQQLDMFSSFPESSGLMRVIDAVNKRMGKNSIFFAAQGTTRAWYMRSNHRTLRYTSCWDELVVARTG
jgi:DNA polymerase V